MSIPLDPQRATITKIWSSIGAQETDQTPDKNCKNRLSKFPSTLESITRARRWRSRWQTGRRASAARVCITILRRITVPAAVTI